LRTWKVPVLALLAVITAVNMNQVDAFIGTKMVDPYWSTLPLRMNAAIAGALTGVLLREPHNHIRYCSSFILGPC
jgi:hypothetical protein